VYLIPSKQYDDAAAHPNMRELRDRIVKEALEGNGADILGVWNRFPDQAPDHPFRNLRGEDRKAYAQVRTADSVTPVCWTLKPFRRTSIIGSLITRAASPPINGGQASPLRFP
jgi:hypothetical protein